MRGFNLPPIPELKWWAVDLDGTLVQNLWTPDSPTTDVGPIIETNIPKLRAIREAGGKIAIHTSRAWEFYRVIEGALDYYGLPYDRIVPGKLLAHRYVDDKAIPAEADSWLM